MSIKVTVQPKTNIVTSVNFGKKPIMSLGQLQDVDASDPDDGEVLAYDAATNKYIVKPVTVVANNITNIAGGTF